MLCRSETEIPPGPGLVYEPKWDGFRCIVFRDGDESHLESRNEPPLAALLPGAARPPARRAPRRGAWSTARSSSPARAGSTSTPSRCGSTRRIAGADAGRREPGDLHRLRPAGGGRRRTSASSPSRSAARRLGAALIPNPQVAPDPADHRSRGGGHLVRTVRGGRLRRGGRQAARPRHTGAAIAAGSRSSISAPSTAWSGGTGRTSRSRRWHPSCSACTTPTGSSTTSARTSSFSAAERRDLLARLRPLEGGTSFGAGRTPGRAVAMDEGDATPTGWPCAPSWSARSHSTTSRATASATPPASCAGAPTRPPASAGTTSCCRPTPSTCSADPGGRGVAVRSCVRGTGPPGGARRRPWRSAAARGRRPDPRARRGGQLQQRLKRARPRRRCRPPGRRSARTAPAPSRA